MSGREHEQPGFPAARYATAAGLATLAGKLNI
jgi:hypothetical protein